MSKNKIGIIGMGWVGKAVKSIFPDASVLDIGIGSKKEINDCDCVFVCVPSNMKEDGCCDTSIVEEVIDWIEAPLICIRSTVEPGTTRRLKEKTGKHICFQPEYIGETVAHPLFDETKRGFIILGGDQEDTNELVKIYQEVYNASIKIMQTDETTAEVVKYMENSFIGTYVSFCNQFYDICEELGVDYNTVREGFLLDPRMTPYWTFVYQNNRGFGGKCIPKDLTAITTKCENRGIDVSFLRNVINYNKRIRYES